MASPLPQSRCYDGVLGPCFLVWEKTHHSRLCCLCLRQGEEGPPSLEYIKAKDLFPQKELVKEDDSLQVSWTGPPSTLPVHVQ